LAKSLAKMEGAKVTWLGLPGSAGGDPRRLGSPLAFPSLTFSPYHTVAGRMRPGSLDYGRRRRNETPLARRPTSLLLSAQMRMLPASPRYCDKDFIFLFLPQNNPS